MFFIRTLRFRLSIGCMETTGFWDSFWQFKLDAFTPLSLVTESDFAQKGAQCQTCGFLDLPLLRS